MFTGKKPARENLFEKAMLSRKDRTLRRRTVATETFHFPFVTISLWSAFSFVGGYILFFSPALMIREVAVGGESILPLGEYQAVAESSMEGTYFGVLSRRNFFFAPTDRITTGILDHYPQIMSVSVKRHFPDSLSISLAESASILRWCTGGPCYGLRDGRAVPIPLAEDSRYDDIRLSVVDESALPVVTGGELPVESYLSTLRAVREYFPKLNIGTLSPVGRTPSRYSGELALSTDEGWELIISVERPVESSLGMLQAFLGEYSKEHTDRSSLTSVDLRVEGKIFYAEKASPIVEMPSPNAAVIEKNVEKKNKKSGQ